jgi:hypothetical protein
MRGVIIEMMLRHEKNILNLVWEEGILKIALSASYF